MPASILSPEEIAAYRRDGYVVPRFRLEGEDLAGLQQAVAHLVEDNPTLLDQSIVAPHVPGSGVQGVKVRSPEYWKRVALHPRIVDMVEQVVGPDIVLWGTTLFYKRAVSGPATGWHRDGQVWPIKPLATTSVWIAATESTVRNGCLRVIPGSHAGAADRRARLRGPQGHDRPPQPREGGVRRGRCRRCRAGARPDGDVRRLYRPRRHP